MIKKTQIDVQFIKKDNGYLVEKNMDKEQEYGRCCDFRAVTGLITYFDILNLESISYIQDNEYVEELNGTAIFCNSNNSISFFGYDDCIKEVEIMILQSDKHNGFYLETFPPTEEDNESYVSIRLILNPIQFQKIKSELATGKVESIRCCLNLQNINGLYHIGYRPWDNFKILYDRNIVSNIKQLPKSFKDISDNKTLQDFKLTMRQQKINIEALKEEEDSKIHSFLYKNISEISSDIKIAIYLFGFLMILYFLR